MTRPLAEAYAKALFEIASAEDAIVAAHAEVVCVRELIAQNPELRALLRDRTILSEGKRNALVELLGDRIHPLVTGWISLLAAQGRAPILEQAMEAFLELSASGPEEVVGDVESALPLTEDEVRRLEEALSEHFHKRVRLASHVVPELIGGVRVRVGSRVIDGSLKRQLQQIYERLVS